MVAFPMSSWIILLLTFSFSLSNEYNNLGQGTNHQGFFTLTWMLLEGRDYKSTMPHILLTSALERNMYTFPQTLWVKNSLLVFQLLESKWCDELGIHLPFEFLLYMKFLKKIPVHSPSQNSTTFLLLVCFAWKMETLIVLLNHG